MKNKIKCLFIISLLLFTIFTTIIPAMAATYPNPNWDNTSKTCYGMAAEIFNPMENDDIPNLMRFDVTNNTGSDIQQAQYALWQTITNVYEVFKPVGYLFCVLYFLIDLIDRTTKEQLNAEHFLRQFIKLLVAIMFIDYALTFFEGFMDLSNAFLEKLANAQVNLGGSNGYLDELGAKLDGEGSITRPLVAICQMVILFFPWIGVKVATIIILLTCWSRLIEMGARICFAPVGMADVFTNGFNGSGFRYMKKIFAVILQGVFIMIIVNLVANISSNLQVEGGLLIGISQLIILFTEVGLIKRSQSFANDLLGV